MGARSPYILASGPEGRVGAYLTQSFHQVGLEKSIPAQILQLILHIDNNKGLSHECVQELVFAKQLDKHSL